MAKITTLIPKQAFELVRLAVFNILGEELASQFNELGNYDADADVYLERYAPVHDDDCPLVNVTLATGDYDGQTAITAPGTYRYNIDCYVASATTGLTDDKAADRLAMLHLSRLLGICRAILEDAQYIRLGFDTVPFINRRYVEKIAIAQPDPNDTARLVMGRITLVVQVNESVALKAATEYGGTDTITKMHLTDSGYMYNNTITE